MAADAASEPPLLSWKGLQWWSVGCRAPAICEIFVGLKTKKLSKLISTNPHKKKGKRRKRREGDDCCIRSAQVAGNDALSSPFSASLQPPLHLSCRPSDEVVIPKRHSSFEERCLSGRIISQLRRNSDAAVGNLRRNSDVSASNPRRNSDATSACNSQQRLSASSPPSCGGYGRVWMLEGGNDGAADHMLPREVKLGGRRSDASVQLGRQDSGVSAQRRTSCSSFSSSSSAASCASKMTSRRSCRSATSGGGEREQRHQNLSQLVVGNQFLTHITAAPLPTKGHVIPHMRPSDGLLLDATSRCREAELKERIIFFL